MRTLLIANRGEIARRIIRTARRMGLSTVAVYSDADAGALHVREADRAVRIGEAAPRASYLSIERVVAAARASGADAVHPGYGFLSENADFAAACVAAGLTFIGPPAAAIAAMGDKARAKERVREHGVPTVPGFSLDGSDAHASAQARALGLPLILKAAAGGGGRGMRVVRHEKELVAAVRSARSEAESSFGRGDLIAERLVEGARHVEIQIAADAHGALIHLGERDCSAQRRHQKVIEEAPSPAVTPELRARMGAAAVAAAKAVDYRGVGTVELLLGEDGAFYFIEMNTRLQVEHAVTEMVCGLDLVEWQLRLARGEPLPLRQEDVQLRGHAIEARVYAEDPSQGFTPCTGRVLAFAKPARSLARLEHALHVGCEVTPHYDPMLAKVVAHGATRDEARVRLVRALGELTLLGVGHNVDYLRRVLEGELMRDGAMTIDALARLPVAPARIETTTWALAALAVLHAEAGLASFWSSSGGLAWPVRLRAGEQTQDIVVEPGAVCVGEARLELGELTVRAGRVDVALSGVHLRAVYAQRGGEVWLHHAGATFAFADVSREPRRKGAAQAQAMGELVSPMSARIVAIPARVGAEVSEGEVLVVLEAMKMEHQLKARARAKIAAIEAEPGGQARRGQVLLRFE